MVRQPNPLGALQDAVLRELDSDVMKLDALLPGDQLEGGQLQSIFDAASDVLKANDVQKAATSYLIFRNMLPYATVDPGSRAGDAERIRAALKVVLDEKSLTQAAELVVTEFRDKDQREDSYKARDNAATELTATLKTTPPRWDPGLNKYVEASVSRLRAQARVIENPSSNKRIKVEGAIPLGQVKNKIITVRTTEHERLYDMATKVMR
jgi:hypothetical protein